MLSNFSYFFYLDDEAWCKIFYGAVDSLADEKGDTVRKVEEGMFSGMVKSEVEDILGPWSGSVEQNKCADWKISSHVKTSFRVYEKSRKSPQETFFKF